MVVPMSKFGFLIYNKDHRAFFEKLYDLGVVHIKKSEKAILQDLKSVAAELEKIRNVIDKLKNHELPGDTEKNILQETKPDIILSKASELLAEEARLTIVMDNLNNEYDYADKWGSYDSSVLNSLKDHGVVTKFYSAHERDFKEEWKEKYRLYTLKHDPPFIHFAVFFYLDEKDDLPVNASPAPERSTSEIDVERKNIFDKIEAVKISLNKLRKEGIEMLEIYKNEQEQLLRVVESAEQSKPLLDGKVMFAQGFVPETVTQMVEKLCADEQIIYFKERVIPDDMPPVLLKNNRFANLFEPLGSLYSLPSYKELDMTPFFAPFFMMFFGFCLGDAGYGVVIFLCTYIFKNKVSAEWRPVLSLARWLALATVVFGILTGTLFGINLLEMEWPWLKSVQKIMINSNQAFNLALMLGLVQIIFGMVLKAWNNHVQFGWKYAIGPIAWILLILGLVDMFVIKAGGLYSKYLTWAAVFLILIYNSPEGSLISRIGKGVWELYGITGLVGDLLSYIRLFALGISGAILGMVINDIALRLLNINYIGWILFIFFLVVGHGANLLIASLGSFVHPLRLTFVEFYKNAGFTGGGEAYQPLGKK